ncbi:prepilin peptidase [Halomonas sp. SpR8]|uniref:prepilin peptidase n=1 Tax=Halomonas sp. SpR8 TaxID=3050463 RepID=UPI0027E3CBE8|nr:prepilin peptidase [Halomonas sp. SpR8]MDQ7728158.1 prepilin peptidase [Halomonas sp. SpR8]
MLILLFWTLVIAYCDLRCRRIGNRLTYPFLLLTVAWLLINAESLAGVSPLYALTGLACALALTIPGHMLGILGGGDVKLMAGIGLTLGGMATLLVIAIAALLLVAWTVLMALLPASTLGLLQRYAPGLANQQNHFAYGPFVFLALATLQIVGKLY